MNTETMTVHEALAELKVLGKRIEKEIDSAKFVATNKHSNLKIDGKPINTYEADIKASYQKINDLIKRRDAIKRAIVQSNAEKVVDVDGTKMTVAEAIEYRNTGITYKERLLSIMSRQYNEATARVATENGDYLEDRANKHVTGLFGSGERRESVDIQAIEETKQNFIKANTVDLINPLELDKKITELKDEIDRFKIKVDSVLSVSNATTSITIEY